MIEDTNIKNLLNCLVEKLDSHHIPLRRGWPHQVFSYCPLSVLLEANGFDVVGFKGEGRVYGLWKSMVIIAKVREKAEEHAAG